MKQPQYSSQNLTHLGILAGVTKRIKLSERVDKILPISKEKGSKVTMGERVCSMVYNALGFMDSRLYMFSEFLHQKPVSRILGPHLNSQDFTDDAIGRCLDKIHEYGTTKLVSDLLFSTASQLDLLGKSIHVDSTSLSLYGEYDNQEQDNTKVPKITHGYSKQKRGDLKQLVLNLAVTSKADLPIFMASHSGNASDQTILIQATKHIEKCCEALSKTPSLVYIADSAMYESCLKESGNILWISRVPLQRKIAKQFILDNKKTSHFKSIPGGYKIYSEQKTVNNKDQRWLLVYSSQAESRAAKTIEKNVEKERSLIDKELKKLSSQIYSCETDALKVLKKASSQWKFHKLSKENIISIEKYSKRGAPKQDSKKETIGYKIQAEVEKNAAVIENLLVKKSHFILATNQLDIQELSDEDILQEYKGQQKVERGFAFIKDNTFEVSSVFLKKPGRIDALMGIMVISLFVYSLTQYLIRTTLKQKGEYIPNQLKKDIQNPTSKWIFFLFRNVQFLRISQHKGQTLECVINLTPLLERIIGYFGKEAIGIYR